MGDEAPQGRTWLTVERVTTWIMRMPPERRVDLLDALRDRFCPYCGEDYKDAQRVCYCTRDD
jgi:hypothetical protein